MRLVSLLPSATEIVYALGLGDDLVGVTFECDEPPAARAEKTVVVGAPITWAEVTDARPDLVIVAPCGYHLAGAVSQAALVTGSVPGVPVWAVDADSLVVRPGPRLVDGVEAIAAILHPGLVPDPPAGSIALVRSPG